MVNILVAEDDNNLRENILFLLKKSGYNVDGVTNGLEALEKYSQNDYSMIISDIMMPYMDGVELYSYIKKTANFEMLPFIFLTAKADSESMRYCMELGADDYLTKPFVAKELLSAVKTRLEKNQLIEKSRSSDKLKSEFLAQISHEIRTPLHAINSLLSLIDFDNPQFFKENSEDLIKMINSSSSRLISLVERMVLVSELKTGEYSPINAEFNLADDIIMPLIEDKIKNVITDKVKLNFNNLTETANIISDERAIGEILNNLIENAIKFTLEGEVDITLEKINSNMVVTIRDTGVGISQEFMDNIFKPFSQEESGYTRSFEGAGLGLTICKYLSDVSDIDLGFDSCKNKGTTAKIIIKNV